MNKHQIRQIVVVLSVAATILMNILANALPFNGQSTGEISDRFQVYFVPAGYVFSIWLFIYIGLAAYAVYQAQPAQRENPYLVATGWLAAASGLVNIIWLFFWHYNLFVLSLAAMLVLLSLLITIYIRLEIGRRTAPNATNWAVNIPFSVYLGWITVATIANASDVFYFLGWNGEPLAPEIWAVIMLAAAVLITTAVLLTRRDIAYSLVIIWAAAGIAVKQSGEPLVAQAALAAAIVAAILAAAAALRILPKFPAAEHVHR